MINTIKILTLGNSLLSIGYSQSRIYALTNDYVLHFIDKKSFDLLKSIPLTKSHEHPHKYANLFSISSKDSIAVPFLGTKKCLVLDVSENVSKKCVIDWHEADIESSAFSNDGKYLATGGMDGKVFIFEEPNFRFLTSLIRRPDYIGAIAFSDNNEYLATSCFDKFVIIFDLIRNRILSVIQVPDIVDRLKFFNIDKKLYMIARNGASIIYDVAEKKTESVENLFHTWPNSLDISKDQKYAIVGTRSESIFIIRLEDNCKLLEIKLEYSGISAIKFYEPYLLIGTVDGTLAVIDYQKGQNELELNAKLKNYKNCREVINNNLFLSIHPLASIFDQDWPEVLQKAILFLNANKIEEATELVEPFLDDPKKRKEFDFYLMQKSNVAEFANAVANKEFQKAFDMSERYKYLQKTNAFLELENYFNKAFSNAKRLLEENAALNLREAEAILKPFEMTIKKDLVYQLLKNSNIFKQADLFIKNKNFKGYFSLVEKFAFLKETDLYKKVQILGEKMMESLNSYIAENKHQEALDTIKLLADFPQFKKACNEKLEFIKTKEALLDAIKRKDVKKVYMLVEKFEVLRNLAEFKEFQLDFNERFEKAKAYAYSGEPKRVMLAMSIYMEIGYWLDKIASLLKIAYLNEIKKHADDPDVNWEMTFKRYILRYGKDSEITRLAREIKQFECLDSIEEKGDDAGYRRHEMVEYMVVHKTVKDDKEDK